MFRLSTLRRLPLKLRDSHFPQGTEVSKGAFIGNYPSDAASFKPEHFHNGVPYVTPELLLTAASDFLGLYDVGAVPVLASDTKRLVGMFSERDLARKVGQMTPQSTVGDVMTRKVISCYPGLSFREALMKMDSHNFRHLPVVDPANGDVVGLISMRDIVHQQLRHGDRVQEVDDFMAWVTKMPFLKTKKDRWKYVPASLSLLLYCLLLSGTVNMSSSHK